MRQVREVLRLKHVCGHSGHQIAAMVGVSRYTVAECLRRAGVVGITWPVPAALDDVALERKLFTPPFAAGEPARPQPEWARIHAELRRPGVTLLLLWEEYRAGQPDGYGYSRFCDLHAAWRGRLSPTMRQTHPAGERLFVDYAGQTVEVIDGATGEVRRAQTFVAVLGASNFTYAEARWTQSLPDWIGCHVGAFASFGGVARQIVCDNLKAGVTAASRYEPGISRTYQDMASHYGTAVLPARVRRPRDKAKVEVAVQVVQRWVLARLRHRRFFSLAELNGAIGELIADLNDRPMRHLGTTRRALFEAIERAALLSLPAEPYAYAEWRRCRAGLDYHVEVHGHFYSVP
jgi:transposase